VGNGIDELLNLLIRACAEGTDRKVVYPTPTYLYYRRLAAQQPAQVIEVPYRDDFHLPIEAIVRAQGALTYIASPNFRPYRAPGRFTIASWATIWYPSDR